MGKTYTWHKLDDPVVAPGQITVQDAGGKRICLTVVEDTWVAFAYKCPHASGIMADGFIQHTEVVCPLHRYRFDLRNGRNTSGEGYHLKTYPVEQREDGLYVGIERSSWF